jgi:hypothetical protein
MFFDCSVTDNLELDSYVGYSNNIRFSVKPVMFYASHYSFGYVIPSLIVLSSSQMLKKSDWTVQKQMTIHSLPFL